MRSRAERTRCGGPSPPFAHCCSLPCIWKDKFLVLIGSESVLRVVVGMKMTLPSQPATECVGIYECFEDHEPQAKHERSTRLQFNGL